MSFRRSKIPKLIPLISFIILLVLGPIVFSFLQNAGKVEAAWVDDNFSYRNAIPITSHTAAESNVYVSATIDTSASGQFQADCGDLRFTTVGGDILPYYIVSGCVSASTVVHVFLKSMPAGAQTLYYYYGNPSASNGFSSADFATVATNYAVGTVASQEKGGAPIAYWKFDDGTGTNAQDSSPNNNDGTLSGTTLPTWQTEDRCISGKCLKFDGSTSRINLTNGGNISYTNGFSISLWFYGNSFSTPNAPELYRVAVTGTNKWISLRIGYNNELEFMTRGASSDIEINSPNNYISENKWYHVTAVYNPSGTTMLFINGIQMTDTSTANAGTITLNGTTTIGQGFNSWSWNGTIDEVKVYSYARTAAQIKSDFKSRGTSKGISVGAGSSRQNSDALSNGLVGYWKTDEATWSGTASEVIDASGNGNHGTAQGTVGGKAYPTGGKFGNSGFFDGVDDYVSAGNPSILNIGTGDFSISVWFKNTTNYSVDRAYFVSKNRANCADYLFGLDLSEKLWLNVRAPSTCLGPSVTSTASYTDGVWHHAVATIKRNESTKLYVDGQQVGSDTSDTITLGSSDITDAANFYLGARNYASTAGLFNGNLDEIRIYNRALSPREVRDLYAWAPGPYTYLSFDEGTGTAINDKSGNGYSGAWNGSGTHWVTGKFGKAGNFNGTSDYVSFSSLPKPTNLPITIEFWTKPSTATPVGIFDSAPSQLYVLRNYASGEVEWWPDTPQLSLGLTASTWTHLAFIYNYSGGNQTIEWYKNGVKQTTVSSAGAGTWAWTSFILGNINGGSAGWYSGDLDEFKIYNYARTQKQIVEDMNAGHPAGGSLVGSQVGYWKMDEGQGSTTNNSGFGSNLNGTITGATWNNNGKFGKALSFAGSTNSVSVSSIANVGTVSLWVNPSTNSQSLLALTAGAYISASSGTITATGFTSPTIYVNGRVGSTLTANVWNHVVVTTDTGITASALTIGRANSSSLTGLIDEVKIYNSALTSDEIQIDYNRGQAMVLGNSGEASSSAGAIYCQPGSSDTCTPPVGEWNFEERSGQTVNDISGNGYSGTLGANSSVASDDPTWTDGILGKALRYDGGDDYANFGDILDMGTSSFTIEFWLKANEIPTLMDIMGKGGASSGGGWRTTIRGTSNLEFSITDVEGRISYLDIAHSLTANRWYFLSFTVTPQSSTGLKYYQDGVLKDTKDITLINSSIDTASNFTIGDTSASIQNLNGSIDDVRIFNYARTQAQIAQDYNQGKPIAQWKMDECQGASVFDASGNGNTGTITIGATGTQTAVGTCTTSGTAWYNGVTGKFNNSLNFDGTDDWVNIADNTNLQFGTNDFALSAWIKTTTAGNNVFVGKYSGSGNNYYLSVGTTTPGVPQISITGGVVNATGKTVNDGQWHFVAGVRAAGVGYIYVDGKLINSGSLAQNASAGGSLGIGKFGSGANYFFDGQIDDVRIYNYALTATQVKTLFNGGAAVKFAPLTGSP